jgi:hypothetical protein
MMRVAIVTTFRADRKEPLVELLKRIHSAFAASDLGEPAIQFMVPAIEAAAGPSPEWYQPES